MTELGTRFRRRPTDAEMKALLGAPPPPNVGDVFPCPGDCLNILTHIRYSWYLTRNRLYPRWTLHVITMAQYRCMSPDDPAAKKPAVIGDPCFIKGSDACLRGRRRVSRFAGGPGSSRLRLGRIP
jgi:hypothetical protein